MWIFFSIFLYIDDIYMTESNVNIDKSCYAEFLCYLY